MAAEMAAAAAGSNMAPGVAGNVAGNAIQAGSGLAATAAGIGFNIWSQLHQNEWNARQMALQNQWNIDQWNRENAYNTPLAQMQRLQAAGINPALAYSNGQLVNEAAGSPSMEASQGRAPQVDPLALSQSTLNAAQVGLMESQSQKNRADVKVELDKLPKELKVLDATEESLKSSSSLNTQLVEQSKAYTKVLGEEFQEKFINNEFLSQTLYDRVKAVKAEGNMKAIEAEYFRDNLKAQLANLQESTKLMRSNRFLNAQMGAHYAALDRHLSFVNQNLDEMTQFIQKRGNNIPVENAMGFINSASGVLNSVTNLVGTILSRGAKPTVNVGTGSKPGAGISPNYDF